MTNFANPSQFFNSHANSIWQSGSAGAKRYETEFNNAKNHIKKVNSYNSYKEYEVEQIKDVLKNSKGYASLPYIAKYAELSIDEAKSILMSSNQFRKSFIIWNGGDVYMLNTRWSLLTDIWKTFCYLNYLKY